MNTIIVLSVLAMMLIFIFFIFLLVRQTTQQFKKGMEK